MDLDANALVNGGDLFYVYQYEHQAQSNSHSSQANHRSHYQELVNMFQSGDIYQLVMGTLNDLMWNDREASQKFIHRAFGDLFFEGVNISPQMTLMKIGRFLSILK